MGRTERSRLALILPALVLCWLAPGLPWRQASAQTQQAKTGQAQRDTTGQISGHVYRSDGGEPIAKATVTLRGLQHANPQVVQTGADGAFVFRDLEPGTYMLQAERTGFVPKNYGQEGAGRNSTINLTAGQTLNDMNIPLEMAGVISGNVTDEGDEPLEGIAVAAMRMRYFAGGREDVVVMHTERTDDLGNFRLAGLMPGSYYLQAAGAEGGGRGSVNASYRRIYYPSAALLNGAQTIQVVAGNEIRGIHLSIPLQVGYSISGVVTDTEEDGPRPYNIMVLLSEGSAESAGLPVATTVTHTDGSFIVHGVPAGDYVLVARGTGGRGLSPGADVLTIVQGDPGTGIASVTVANADSSANIVIGRAGAVRGEIAVDGAKGAGSFGVSVALEASGGRRAGSRTSVGATGTFAIEGIAPGRYSFVVAGAPMLYVKQATCAGADYAVQPVVMDSGTLLSDCKILLANDAGAFTGRVMDGDNGVPDMVVVAIPESRTLRRVARYAMRGKTDGNGLFHIVGVIPGEYELFAVPEDEYGSYFALDFADRNQNSATRVSLKPGENQVVMLTPTVPQ
jgi:uncharacterized protein (DUF2141 family)